MTSNPTNATTPPPAFDPQRIAREAANNILTGLDCSEREHNQATALILTAAARIVRESGAVEALNEDIISARIIHSEAEHNGKWAIQRDCAFIEERCYKALAQLRALGEAQPGRFLGH